MLAYADGTLRYPHKPVREPSASEAEDRRAFAAATGASSSSAEPATTTTGALSGVKGKTWFAGTPLDAPRDGSGNLEYGWHWNMPYSVKRNLPAWYKKEVDKFKVDGEVNDDRVQ